MGKPFTLYWSTLDMYEKCPQQFLWSRGWGNIDCGGGPGRRKPKPQKSSEHAALLGTVIQAVLERFYNDELWRTPEGLGKRLEEMVETHFRQELLRRYIDWRMAPSQEEMLRQIRDGVLNFLKTWKHNKLVGPYAQSEVEYLAYIDKYTPIGGRLDFLIRREDTGITILDGKNSKTKGKYTDPDQLRWYALCFWLKTKTMPDRLGFVYFRYPWGYIPPEEEWETGPDGQKVAPPPSEGVDWVPFTKDDLKGLAHRALEARKKMEKELFEANPSPSQCRFCDYESVCPARQTQIASNRRKKKPNEIDDLLGGGGGFKEWD